MISFVWPDFMPFVPWAGGSEVYTLGHLRELQRRGIPTRMIACTPTVAESIARFPDIPLLTLKNENELSELDDRLVFLFLPVKIPTKHPASLIVHTPIVKGPTHDDADAFANNALGSMRLIATSKYMSKYWQETLSLPEAPPVVYPFAHHIFSEIPRMSSANKVPRILFAGRPTPEKGFYTLLASLHMPPLYGVSFELSCVANINQRNGANVINAIYEAHPQITALPPRNTREGMAKLYAEHDIVVVPSSNILWIEAFGMIALEAQQAGCRVVASNNGGLPETDCGGLLLVEPDNPLDLAEGLAKAIKLGPLSTEERKKAAKRFTVEQSVDALLKTIS